MGQRIIKIAPDLLHDLLLLPDAAKVIGMSADLFFHEGNYAIKIESPDFEETKVGQAIPIACPMYRVTDGKPEFSGWIGNAKQLATIDASNEVTQPLGNGEPKRMGREFI